MTYTEADDLAAQLVEQGRARIVFVTLSVTHAGYDVAQYQTALGSPVKRYRVIRHNEYGARIVECKEVTTWRRN